MKKLFWLLIALFGAVLVIHAQTEPTAATLIDDFDTGYEDGGLEGKWWTYVDDAGSTFSAVLDTTEFYNGTTALHLTTNIVAEGGYAGIGFDYGLARDWQAGAGIVLRLRASVADLPLNIVLHVTDETQTSTFSPGVTPFGCRFNTPAESTTDWTLVTLSWDCFQRLMWVGTDGIMEFTAHPIRSFEIAFESEGELQGEVWIDDLRVISETDLSQAVVLANPTADLPVIRASQIGYRPADPKLFVTTVAATEFALIEETSGKTVYNGKIEAWGLDVDSAAEVYQGRFDEFTQEGIYHIALPSGETSYPFAIGETAYAEVTRLAARALYLQRSGIAIQDVEDSGLELAAGHTAPAVLWSDQAGATLDVQGGWYDAGDFGRYIPTGAFAVNQLLIGFTLNPEFFADGTLNIPESGNGLPDLLDEIRWELDWMLKMQREDGAVYHKVTSRSFPSYGTLPAEDAAQLFVFDISSADTAYFAAAIAQAARVFADYDAEYAAQLLSAAERAWAWLSEHPEQVPVGGFQNPPLSEYPMQGGYDFVGAEDVPRMWAAAELFAVTGESAYETAFAQYFAAVDPQQKQAMSWANAYPMALYAYLSAATADEALHAEVAVVFQSQAQLIYETAQVSGYQVALNDGVAGFEYVWGSNQVALAHGLYLVLAHQLFEQPEYLPAALDQVQFVLGVNPLAKCYLSGIGTDSVLYPHHNTSFHFRKAVPGFVTEGANSQSSGGDAVLEGLWELELPVALRYSDHWDSWASNEPTIDANATFVALIAYWAR